MAQLRLLLYHKKAFSTNKNKHKRYNKIKRVNMAISTNMNDFMKSLDADIEKQIEKRDELAKSIINRTYDAIITMSPFHSRYYAHNHFISEDTPKFRELESDSKPNTEKNAYENTYVGSPEHGKTQIDKIKLKHGKKIFIHNSLDYAQALEDGHSKQNKKMYHQGKELAKDLIAKGL